ncbi:MAG: hypothetical protein N3A54_05175, partial [Patescibacteria group bacterium]|nr:hypothetical protein [Patescibacteria group bacterium]
HYRSMHRNTFVFVIFLAVFAAIVAGVNIAKIYSPQKKTEILVTPSPSPIQNNLVSSQVCDFIFSYPKTFTKIDIETGGVTLMNRQKEEDIILILCQEKALKIPEDMKEEETIEIGTVSAQIYSQQNTTQKQSKQRLTFIHPRTKKYIYISGSGQFFDEFIKTIKIVE